ncbi:MAG: hypothetical protein ACYDEE_16820 [Ignavibacteriaceae bacterium]
MNKDLMMAFYWARIIKLAFSPLSDHDKDTWLRCYAFSLLKFWGIQNLPSKLKVGQTIKFENKFLNITYDCIIENYQKGSFSISIDSATNNTLLWYHDIDPHYYHPSLVQILPAKLDKRWDQSKVLQEELGNILDGLIFHPHAHQHIDMHIPDSSSADSNHTTNHDVRIGGGITNPFLFLFQLRYQFCIIKQNREEEQKRLLNLFSTELNMKSPNISAGKLFGISR